jgi:hypothetical protein
VVEIQPHGLAERAGGQPVVIEIAGRDEDHLAQSLQAGVRHFGLPVSKQRHAISGPCQQAGAAARFQIQNGHSRRGPGIRCENPALDTRAPVDTAPAHHYTFGVDFQGDTVWVATAKGLSQGLRVTTAKVKP